MMRVVMMFFWCLLLTWFVTTDLGAQAPARKQARGVEAVVLTVTGYGLDEETAKRHALGEAQKELAKLLRSRKAEYWIPSADYIRKNLLEGPGSQGDDLQVQDGELAKTWVLRVKSPHSSEIQRWNSQARAYVEQRQRELHAPSRLHIMTKGLAAVLVFLIAMLGYLRLEERTQGIYTHLLRAGMICLVAGAGAGILFLS